MLDRKAFVVVRSDGVGAQLSPGSIFHFRQSGKKVSADYMGMKVVRGHLEGEIRDGMLFHHYEQMIRTGRSIPGMQRLG